MRALPTREEIREAWGPFGKKYPAYLATKNRDNWLMQDLIVHDYMVGALMTADEWSAKIDQTALETAVADLVVGASGIDRDSIHWGVVTKALIDAALGIGVADGS